jgi:hypothetical protein
MMSMPNLPGNHSHLDRGVRDPGECPGCDRLWRNQEARLTAARKVVKTIREQEAMAERTPATTGGTPRKWCPAIRDTGREVHTCIRLRGHSGKHLCALCQRDW